MKKKYSTSIDLIAKYITAGYVNFNILYIRNPFKRNYVRSIYGCLRYRMI